MAEKKTTKPAKRNPAAEYNRPFVVQKAVLGSHVAQEAFRRTFTSMEETLYSLGVVLRVVGNAQDAEAVEALVDEKFDAMAKEINEEKARLDKMLKDNDIQDKVEFTSPSSVEAHISSPRAGRYMSLIREIDKLVAKMTALWLYGVLQDQQYTKGNFRWIGRFRTLSVEVRNINHRAMRAANQKRSQAQAEAAKKEKEKQARKDAKADEAKAAEAEEAPVVTAEAVEAPVVAPETVEVEKGGKKAKSKKEEVEVVAEEAIAV